MATGVLTDLGTMPPHTSAPSSTAYSVTNDGIVVGTSETTNGLRAFAYDLPAKSMKDLGGLGTSNMLEVRDISNAGVTVGFSHVSPDHAWRTTVSRHY
jgi:probable HAF family extracellular repeat protein